MFFNKISLKKSDVFAGVTDCHSHILPGVDDGVKSVEEALGILTYFESLGIKRVVLTPHIMEDYPLNNLATLKEKFNSLRDVYSGSIKLSLGAEYMLDGAFEQLLDSNDLMPILDDHLLIETSYMSTPINFWDLITQIRSKGYHVILAHPERYMYMDSDFYDKLKKNRVLFQLNILSLAGAYGHSVKIKSRELLKKGYYNCIGSDIHNLYSFRKQIEQMQISNAELRTLNKLKK